jgi:hypothetical protein
VNYMKKTCETRTRDVRSQCKQSQQIFYSKEEMKCRGQNRCLSFFIIHLLHLLFTYLIYFLLVILTFLLTYYLLICLRRPLLYFLAFFLFYICLHTFICRFISLSCLHSFTHSFIHSLSLFLHVFSLKAGKVDPMIN